jgi:hypothetical protein
MCTRYLSSPPKENAGGQRTPIPMKTIFSFVGFVVIMILLASTGVVKGDACLSNVGCVGATGGGITFHSPSTVTTTTP